MGFNSVCDTGLALGLGLSSSVENNTTNSMKASFELSLTLSLPSNHLDHNKKVVGDDLGGLYRQESVVSGGGSSSVSVKREREIGSDESERVSNNYSKVMSTTLSGGDDVEDDDGSVNGRKKLRLTKPQSALLEEAFKVHSTLNPKQKQELARELKLRPRQVEVWFQNRRARSKLKQTEVDCEYLKKCCEALTDENRRLHKEVQELKAMKLAQPPVYMQLPAARITMCPSCERVIGDTGSATKSPFTMAPKPPFFNPFSNPSAAC